MDTAYMDGGCKGNGNALKAGEFARARIERRRALRDLEKALRAELEGWG